MLVGFAPGVTVTVNTEFSPGRTEFGLAWPEPVGLVEVETVSGIEPLPIRLDGAVSVMVKGKLFTPPVVPFATVALNEKTLSPAVTSPLEPSSKKVCVALPPMEVRLALTVWAVLAGFEAGSYCHCQQCGTCRHYRTRIRGTNTTRIRCRIDCQYGNIINAECLRVDCANSIANGVVPGKVYICIVRYARAYRLIGN